MKKLALILLLFCGCMAVPNGYVLLPKSELNTYHANDASLSALLLFRAAGNISDSDFRRQLGYLSMHYDASERVLWSWRSVEWYVSFFGERF